MHTSTSFRVFLSAASAELASYREEIARVLRRKNIDVREEKHFRQGGATLLEALDDYIKESDAVICLIGDHCGSLPSDEHMAVMDDNDWVERFRESSGQSSVSYTQWEFLLAKSQNKPTYVYLTDGEFIPNGPNKDATEESAIQQSLQMAYRNWIKNTGEHWTPLTTVTQLIEDVLVLPFPDLMRGKPNSLPQTSLGTMFKGREQFLKDLHRTLNERDNGNSCSTAHSISWCCRQWLRVRQSALTILKMWSAIFPPSADSSGAHHDCVRTALGSVSF